MTDEQINKIWRDLQNRYWESTEEMHIRFARALLAASAPTPRAEQVATPKRQCQVCVAPGYACTREANHAGPCAAIAAPIANPSDKQEALTNEQIADLAANYCIGGQYRDIVAFGKAVRSAAPLANPSDKQEVKPQTDAEALYEAWTDAINSGTGVVKISHVPATEYAAPLAQSAEQDRIDARSDASNPDLEEIRKALNSEFKPMFPELQGVVINGQEMTADEVLDIARKTMGNVMGNEKGILMFVNALIAKGASE